MRRGMQGTYAGRRQELRWRSYGLPVIWDFRSGDVHLGGEGAPFAPIFHHACARLCGADRGRVAFLKPGGVGNLDGVDPALPLPETDAGPTGI